MQVQLLVPELNDAVDDYGIEDHRRLTTVRLGNSGIFFELMIYGGALGAKRPLVILNSIDFAMPPPETFCRLMWQHDFQVIFIRRSGFGLSTPLPDRLMNKRSIANGATAVTEAVLVNQLLLQSELRGIILLGFGSATPVCSRLSTLSPNIKLTILSNPVFNSDIVDVFRPAWFQMVLKQVLSTRTGIFFAEAGIKHQLKRNPMKFYLQVAQKSAGDIKFIEENEADIWAASLVTQDITALTMYYDTYMSLRKDSFLKDRMFEPINIVALSGEETSVSWRSGFLSECHRLGLPPVFAPSGDMFAPYQSPETLLSIIANN